jgi:putative membrane protein
MKRFWVTVAAVGLAGLSGCKEPVTSISNNQTQGVTDEAPVENSGTLNMSEGAETGLDRTYVMAAAASDLFEMESSRLALQKASSDAVKGYAELMLEEHGKSSEELKAAAGAAGISPPATLPQPMQAKLAALSGLSGAAFDRQYVADQRAGHQQTLALVNQYLASAPAGPLKDHASKLTGVVQKHLNELEKIK